ncbi:hypothetical protein APV28_0384 [Comamonas testosteroni]|nr:hypothetical protein APV28_0384 [Comamonas testosteroni]
MFSHEKRAPATSAGWRPETRGRKRWLLPETGDFKFFAEARVGGRAKR